MPFLEWHLHRYGRSYGDRRDAYKRPDAKNNQSYNAQNGNSDMVCLSHMSWKFCCDCTKVSKMGGGQKSSMYWLGFHWFAWRLCLLHWGYRFEAFQRTSVGLGDHDIIVGLTICKVAWISWARTRAQKRCQEGSLPLTVLLSVHYRLYSHSDVWICFRRVNKAFFPIALELFSGCFWFFNWFNWKL